MHLVRIIVAVLPFLLLFAREASAGEVLVDRGAAWRYFKGQGEASDPVEAWRDAEFDDTTWPAGPAPFRYGDGSGGTLLDDMQGNFSTLYLRHEFEITDLDSVENLRLEIDYDDGFIAWINSVEIERSNAPSVPLHDALAPGGHESGSFERFNVSDREGYLRAGSNVIAVQVFNSTLSSSDLMLDLELRSARLVADTRFSHHRGFYEAPIGVTIWTSTPEAHIRYTTDGSAPTPTSGNLYTEPVAIHTTTVLRAIAYREDFEPSNVDTQTYIYLADVLRQPAAPPGYPLRWGDAVADYAMDPRIVDDPRYRDHMIRAMRSIPTLSIVMDQDDMFGSNGIYANGGSGQNSGWERAVSVELIYPDGRGGFQIDGGIRPHSHVAGPRKRSFKLLFKREYGATKLRFPFFESAPQNADSAANKFDRIILRAGLNRCWANQWNPDDTCYTRDQWARDSQIAMSGVGSHGTLVHLYINGLYWGLYNPCERPDAWFTSEYLGGEQEDWFAINHGGSVSGNRSRYDHLVGLADERRLEEPAKYDEVREYLDVALFADYLILNWYAGTGDWPNNNWYGGNSNSPTGPFRYFCWDAEDIFDPLGSGRPGRSNDGAWVHADFRMGSSSSRTIARIWRALRENEDFMVLFADRVHRHSGGDGALTEENSRKRWWALNDAIEEAILGESARWGDAREGEGDPVRTREDDWKPEVERVSNVSIAGNVPRLLAALRAERYYPEIDPPVITPRGHFLIPELDVRLESSWGDAEVYYTLDGSDPRVPETGTVSSVAQVYSMPLAIAQAAVLKTRARRGSEWSALAEAVFYPLQDMIKLRITEIMYHPPTIGPLDEDEYEFLELKNTGNSELDLSGVCLSGGISYRFPFGAKVGPGEFIVLVSNAEMFASRYAGVAFDGVYDRHLSNRSEIIKLRDGRGETLIELLYHDSLPWPETADGEGHSLVPRNAAAVDNPNDPAGWRHSRDLLGSPGRDDGEELTAAPVLHAAPRDLDVAEGAPALFTVSALGVPLPSYQWQRNGVDIPGAQSWYYAIPQAPLADSGARFRCVITNSQGTVTSSDATLRVSTLPVSGTLVSRGSPWRYFKGMTEPSNPLPRWRDADFPDTSWAEGPAPFGYGDPPFGTVLDDMEDSYATVYLRQRFQLPEDLEVTLLTLTANYDDGFALWINGNEVLRVNVNADAEAHDAFAAGSHESGSYEPFPLADPYNYLNAGDNVVAVQVFNANLSSSDLKLDLNLGYEARRARPRGFVRGDSNRDGSADVSDAIHILRRIFLGDAGDDCNDARDVNDDGRVNITDPIVLLNFLFLGGPRPEEPFELCGLDRTPDELRCEEAVVCAPP